MCENYGCQLMETQKSELHRATLDMLDANLLLSFVLQMMENYLRLAIAV